MINNLTQENIFFNKTITWKRHLFFKKKNPKKTHVFVWTRPTREGKYDSAERERGGRGGERGGLMETWQRLTNLCFPPTALKPELPRGAGSTEGRQGRGQSTVRLAKRSLHLCSRCWLDPPHKPPNPDPPTSYTRVPQTSSRGRSVWIGIFSCVCVFTFQDVVC